MSATEKHMHWTDVLSSSLTFLYLLRVMIPWVKGCSFLAQMSTSEEAVKHESYYP